MYKKITLPNGLRIVLAPMKESKSITIMVLVNAGSKHEQKEINGISHFLEHMFFKGTKKRSSALAVSEFMDRVGGEYNAFTSKEYTGFWAKVASRHWELGMDWISDMLLNSKFDALEINKERGVIVEEINMVLDSPMRYVSDLWENLLYGDQPAGWDIIGPKENIAKLSREQFLEYMKNHYGAENVILCLAGNLPAEKIVKENALKFFKKIEKGGGLEGSMTKEDQTKPESLVYFKETDQTHFCLGTRAYDLFHSDRYTLSVLAAILGGMMSSRLFISVREQKGLCYYIHTDAHNYTDSGFLVTQAGVANSKVKEAIKAVLEEYVKIKNEKVGIKELSKAKERLMGAMLLGLETSDEVASWIGMQELLKKEILTAEQIFAKIKAVSAADIKRVAQDIFKPEKLNLAMIGPFKEKKEFEEILKI